MNQECLGREPKDTIPLSIWVLLSGSAWPVKRAAAGGLHVIRSEAEGKRKETMRERDEIMWLAVVFTSGKDHRQQCWPGIPGLRGQMQEDHMFEASLTPI